MKKYFIIMSAAFVLMVGLPLISHAAQGAPIRTMMRDDIEHPLIATMPPRLTGSSTASTTIRERIREDMNRNLTNMRNNQDVRNDVLMDRAASSTMHGSSTMPMRPPMGQFMNNMQDRRQMIHIELDHVGRNLDIVLANLKQIRGRINTVITNQTAKGHDMTTGKAALAIADQKLTVAAQAVASYDTLASSTDRLIDQENNHDGDVSSTTLQINLDIHRAALKTASQDLNDARKALSDTVVAIARSLGQKLEDASSTSL